MITVPLREHGEHTHHPGLPGAGVSPGLQSASWGKHSPGLLPAVLGGGRSKAWCWGDADEGLSLSCGR